MNANKNGRLNTAPITPTLTVVPVTRAIRVALAISFTLLALGGSSVAFAQTCAATTATTETCEGAFTNTVPDSAFFTPVADLTLVLGDSTNSVPTSVIPATGLMGINANWTGNVGVTSYADITTVGATGLFAYGSTSATVNNSGAITTNVSAAGARAMDISANGDVSVINNGPVNAYSTGVYDVTAVNATSVNGNVSVDNQAAGTISAAAQDGNAIAINAYAAVGAVTVSNEGSVTASSVNGAVTAIDAKASIGDVSVTNAGSVSATISSNGGNYSGATGIYAASASGAATVSNSGDINVENNPGNAYARATGINARGVNSTVTNAGSIEVDGASAYGVIAYASAAGGLASVTNTATGTIAVTGKSITGVTAGGYFAAGYVDNAGAISTTAAYCGAYCYTDAVGVKATTVNNAGSITVSSGSANSFSGGAQGIHARSYRTDAATISNSGTINVDALGYHGDATGIYAFSSGTISVLNSGGITVTALGGIARARGIATDAIGNATIANTGDIYVGAGNTAFGIYAFSEAVQQVSNTGSITAVGSTAEGIETFATTGNVDNSGTIRVTANGAFGIQANSQYGDNAVTNSGDINVASYFQGHGVNTYVLRGAGVATFDNSGTIDVSTHISPNASYVPSVVGGAAYGANVVNAAGDSTISNTGSITSTLYAYSEFANGLGRYQSGARGLTVYGHTGNISISNAGSIAAASEVRSLYFGTNAVGIQVTNDFGDVDVANSGTISASAQSDYRSAGGQSLATGVLVNGFRGDDTINNSSTGVITAAASTLLYNSASAIGIDGYAVTGTLAVTNAGAINATAHSAAASYYQNVGQTTATGVVLTNTFGATTTVSNSSTGVITAKAVTDLYGAANAIGINASVNYGDVNVANAGTITATALATGHTDAYDAATATGVLLSNTSYINGATTTFSSSDGAITATASAALSAVATGVAISGVNVDVTSAGAINATASADATLGTAEAIGLMASGSNVALSLGAGSNLSAAASGNSGSAIGLLVSSDSALTASNAGAISATFTGAHGSTYGAIIASSGDVSFTNSGHITAAQADNAVGIELSSPSAVTLINSGTITVDTTAAGSLAVLTGDANALIQNSGTINGAIQTGSGNDTLTNGIGAVWNTGLSTNFGAGNNVITNSGTITGALVTGDGNDTLTNAVGGIWNAVGASDFGAGDDTVTNAGTINLNNTTISLGSDPAGNQFGNAGVITVVGSNTITMGTGTTVNPNPFTNNGTINFRNGEANNVLTIVGNFAGNGQLDMDVDGANSTGDLLKITGNVAAGSVNTVNVNLLSDPTTASTTIPLVQVAGTGATGAFVLGTFVQPKGFLGLSEALVSTSNAASLGLTVTPATVTAPPATPPPSGTGVVVTVSGLSQLGTLAASAAPGVQSLMTSQIGTLQDRMGAVSQTIKGGLSLWTRVFANSGTVDPDHTAGNFGQNGNFGFDQSNTGEELGLDFAIADTIKAGALFAKSQANQSLDGNQADSSQIKGNTSGIYGTYVDPSGLYVDVSYRWMSFNDRLHAPNGYASIHGNADAFNLEAGKTWVLQNGLQIAPQFQYTLTKVDNINAQTGGVAGFQSSGDESSRARLGVMFSKAYTPVSSHALWMPYASLSVVQETDGANHYAVNDTFFGETNTKGTSVLAETGVNVQVGKLAVFGGLNWQDGGAQKSFFGGQVGLRYTF